MLFISLENSQRRVYSILLTWLLCLKRNVSQIYHLYNLLRGMLHVITRSHYFLYKFIITQRFGETAMLLCSLKQVSCKKSAIYIRYLHNNKIQCWLKYQRSTTKFLLLKFVDSVSLLFHFVNVPHFPLWIEFLKLKSWKFL